MWKDIYLDTNFAILSCILESFTPYSFWYPTSQPYFCDKTHMQVIVKIGLPRHQFVYDVVIMSLSFMAAMLVPICNFYASTWYKLVIYWLHTGPPKHV